MENLTDRSAAWRDELRKSMKNKELLKYCNDIELKSFQSPFFDKFISVLNSNFPIRFVASKNSQISHNALKKILDF